MRRVRVALLFSIVPDPPVGGMKAEVGGENYFVARSTSYVNWLILRGFLVDGKTDAAVKMFKTGLKVYPPKSAGNLGTPRCTHQ